MTTNQPKYEFPINEKMLRVFDKIFSKAEIKELAYNLNIIPAFRKKNLSSRLPNIYHIRSPLPEANKNTRLLYRRLDKLMAEVFPNRTLKKTKAYCQKNLFGQDAYRTSFDTSSGNSEFIALVHANESWDRSWGGELILYNRKGDAVGAVSHTPGRVTILESSIEHCLSIPQKLCYVPQLMVMIHYANPYRVSP